NTDNAPESGIDLPIDNVIVKYVLVKGRKYLTKKGRLKAPLNKEIKILWGIMIGSCIPLFAVSFWLIYTQTFNPGHIPVIFGLGFLMLILIPCSSLIRLIKKRKCEKCNANFALEITKSKLLDEKQLYTKQGNIKLRRTENNTYKCSSCGNISDKKEFSYHEM
ncbi:MAG: hypothetical protein ACREAK_07065, partial [Nitrosarchaeum sp.]